MKKITKILILLLLLFPVTAFAANAPTLNKNYATNSRDIELADIGVEKGESGITSFKIYEATEGNALHFHIYSLNRAAASISPNLKSSETNKVDLSGKKALLNTLLSNVNQINKTNSESINNITNTTELLNIFATQILVWEIVEGNRTSFDKIANNNSIYYRDLVSINRNNTTSSGLPSLYDVYSNIVKTVNEKNSQRSNNSKDNPYKLYYNVNNNRYQNIITSIDYNTLKSNYDISNTTNIKLASNPNGLLAYVSGKNFFSDVKSIGLSQKAGSTNTALQQFYYFNTSSTNEDYVLASKADRVPTSMYFACAQGNFKITTLEGNGGTILGSVFNIKDSKGNLLKFTNDGKNSFTYDATGSTGVPDITYIATNSYVINNVPDGEYSIIQTAVPVGNSFPSSEEARTTKIKIENGSFYSYNKILRRYELNSMHIVKFTNYISKLYVIDTGNSGSQLYTISKENYGNIALYYNSGIYQAYETTSGSALTEIAINSNTKNLKVYGLDRGNYTITNTTTNEKRNFTIKNDSTVGESILISFDNKKNEISFYKLDEKGKYLTGGLFSLRMIDPTKQNSEEYVDIALTKESGTNTYSISSSGKEYTFSATNGKVVIKGTEPGKTYRIVELTPPDGYQLFDSNMAYVDFTIDASGYAKSTPYIINKEIMVNADASSNSELIISIRTGQEIIKYGIIILSISAIIVLLFITNKKTKK